MFYLILKSEAKSVRGKKEEETRIAVVDWRAKLALLMRTVKCGLSAQLSG